MSELRNVACPAKIRFDERNDVGVLRHMGIHCHDVPPVSKLDADSEKKFGQLVLMAPEAKPSQIVIGMKFLKEILQGQG
jgi:hypothetical protein